MSTKSTTAAKRSVPTDAPMLNYIFDAHSTLNKHQHHHDHRWGPHFEGESKNMTVQAGGSAILDCRISLLQDKTVSVFPFVSLSTLACSKLVWKLFFSSFSLFCKILRRILNIKITDESIRKLIVIVLLLVEALLIFIFMKLYNL